MHLVKHTCLELALYNTVSFEYQVSCGVFSGLWGVFLVYGRNVSFGNLNLSSSRGIGHLYFTPVMETKRVLSK